ncbi:hypothetical protein [Streptomyces sp. OE57]
MGLTRTGWCSAAISVVDPFSGAAGWRGLYVSLSHDAGVASAVVIAEG